MKFRGARILVFSLLWPGVVAPGHAAQVEIVLQDEVALSGGHYSLADIARVESGDTGLAKRLSAIVIGRSPRPGFKTRLSRNAIAARLEALYPGTIRDFKWSGQARVTVRSTGVAFSGERLNQLAFEFLNQRLQADFRDYRIEAVSVPRDLLLPPGAVSVKARLRENAYFTRRISVWVDIHVDGKFVQTLPLWFALSIHQQVLVAAHDLERSEAVSARGLHKAYVDITRAGGRVVSELKSVSGMRLKQPLAAGSILTEEMLQPVPAVSSGQRVRVTAKVGNIQLNTRAIALSDGRLEQKIQVRNPDSGELYSVVVTGHAQTRVY